MRSDSRFAVRDGVMFNRVGDELVLLDLDRGIYLGLDAVGSRFWELITGGASIAEAVETMLAEYDVARDELEADLAGLLAELEQHALITAKS
ncbi:MAG TPA: PqqD family protein [Thermoanaerobaculia bacterium]|jgi:hypothetical protein